MAYDKTALSHMGHTGAADANNLWFYADPDDDGADTISGAGYFDDMAGLMRKGDLVFLCGGSDVGAMAYVSSDTGDDVELSNCSTSAIA
ncbi:MAG: hypothetical protein ACLFWM_10850 [Actinomycetota bacterium]